MIQEQLNNIFYTMISKPQRELCEMMNRRQLFKRNIASTTKIGAVIQGGAALAEAGLLIYILYFAKDLIKTVFPSIPNNIISETAEQQYSKLNNLIQEKYLNSQQISTLLQNFEMNYLETLFKLQNIINNQNKDEKLFELFNITFNEAYDVKININSCAFRETDQELIMQITARLLIYDKTKIIEIGLPVPKIENDKSFLYDGTLFRVRHRNNTLCYSDDKVANELDNFNEIKCKKEPTIKYIELEEYHSPDIIRQTIAGTYVYCKNEIYIDSQLTKCPDYLFKISNNHLVTYAKLNLQNPQIGYLSKNNIKEIKIHNSTIEITPTSKVVLGLLGTGLTSSILYITNCCSGIRGVIITLLVMCGLREAKSHHGHHRNNDVMLTIDETIELENQSNIRAPTYLG